MFSYPSYPRYFDQRRLTELDAIADDLEYRASRARRAARVEPRDFLYHPRHRVYDGTPRYIAARRRADTFELPRRRSLYYESGPLRRTYHDAAAIPLYDDGIDEPYFYTQSPSHVQHLRPYGFDSGYSATPPEQNEREVRESRVHAVAERAHARAEARRVEALEQHPRAEQRLVYARKQREEQERAQLEEQSRALAARGAEEAVHAVASLILGSQTVRNPSMARRGVPDHATLSSIGGLEDFLGHIVGLQHEGTSRPPTQVKPDANMQAHKSFLPALQVHFSPVNVATPRATAPTETEKHSNAVPKAASPSKHSIRLPVPGRSFSHLPQNPRDPGLSTDQLHRRSGAADEVADIMEAIKRSLDPTYNAVPSHIEQAPALAASRDSSAPSDADAKPPVTPECLSKPTNLSQPQPTPPNAMATMKAIEARLADLNHQFVFPPKPDSLVESSQKSSTPTDSAIRAHEHELTGLLTELDAVESDGDEDIRRVRKGLVSRIETELAHLERKKDDAWKLVSSTSSAKSDGQIEGYTIPSEPDSAPLLAHQEGENAANAAIVAANMALRHSSGNDHAQPSSAPTAFRSQPAPPLNNADAKFPPRARGDETDPTASGLESTAEPVPEVKDVSPGRTRQGDSASAVPSTDDGGDRSTEFVVV